jgi:low affinity Fe/Cu permease
MNQMFHKFAHWASWVLGSPYSFLASLLLLVIWAALGPALGFSENWQLIINTSTTIITFLSVFLIQNTQNREARAVQLKLDEVLRAIEGAHNEMIDIENLSDEQLARLERHYHEIRESANSKR